MPHLWHVEPPLRFERAPFDSALRHKRGSRIDLSHPETSCYREQNNDGCSVTPKSIDQVIYSIFHIHTELLINEVLALIAQISASNAGAVWLGVFLGSCPLRACRYAAIVGTIVATGNRLLNTASVVRCAARKRPDGRGESRSRASTNRVRHGGAASCRHVAPAVLLC